MIYTVAQVTTKNNTSSLDKPIILYRGDKNIEIQFILMDRNFAQYEIVETNIIDNLEASFGQLVIVKPNGIGVFSEITPTSEGKVIFTMPGEMIDERSELGTFTFQIRLYDKDMSSRVTLPPCIDGLIIEEPIVGDI